VADLVAADSSRPGSDSTATADSDSDPNPGPSSTDRTDAIIRRVPSSVSRTEPIKRSSK
jgi:hypothetical protein